MGKQDPLKRVGQEVKRAFDRASDRMNKARTKLQAPGGYTPADLATDVMSAWLDVLDLWTSPLAAAATTPILLVSAPVAAFNAPPPGPDGVARASVSLEARFDPPMAISSSDLALTGPLPAGAPPGTLPFLKSASLVLELQDGGATLFAKLMGKVAGDPDAIAGLYQGMVTVNVSQDIVVAAVKVLLF